MPEQFLQCTGVWEVFKHDFKRKIWIIATYHIDVWWCSGQLFHLKSKLRGINFLETFESSESNDQISQTFWLFGSSNFFQVNQIFRSLLLNQIFLDFTGYFDFKFHISLTIWINTQLSENAFKWKHKFRQKNSESSRNFGKIG